MDTTQRALTMQRWYFTQYEIIPDLGDEVGVLTPKLEKVIHTLEWVRIEEFVQSTWCGIGRPPHDRQMLACAFVAKTVLGIKTTVGLIERLQIDKALRRICGFPLRKKLPSEASFSRAFAEFAEANLAERAHESLVKTHLGDALIGHISRDATAIEVREKPKKTDSTGKSVATADLIAEAESTVIATPVDAPGVDDLAGKDAVLQNAEPTKTDDVA